MNACRLAILWASLIVGLSVTSCGSRAVGNAEPSTGRVSLLRSESDHSDEFSSLLVTMSADWPTSREEADSTLSRLGYTRGMGGKTGAVSYDKKDSVAEIGLLVNLDAGLLVGKYTPVHMTPMGDELLRVLKEKSEGVEFFPPDEFQYRLVESLTGWQTVTYVGVAMPSGAWRYTSTTMKRLSARP